MESFMAIGYMLWSIGIFFPTLVCEKSGNLVKNMDCVDFDYSDFRD
jgi:hypothetical protein